MWCEIVQASKGAHQHHIRLWQLEEELTPQVGSAEKFCLNI